MLAMSHGPMSTWLSTQLNYRDDPVGIIFVLISKEMKFMIVQVLILAMSHSSMST